MYNPAIVEPMRKELTNLGFKELRSPEEVNDAFGNSSGTTNLCVVNSVCGCAAGGARPGVKLALENQKLPASLTTVFAGQDKEATAAARGFFVGYAPSSPSMALLKNGKVVYMLERSDIEGSSPEQIAEKLRAAFNSFC